MSGPLSPDEALVMPGKRVIASLGAGSHQSLLAIARRTIEPYATRHGYELILQTEAVDDTRPPPWSKVRMLQELVDSYDLVVWLDADLVIVDQRVDIASELAPSSFLGLVEHRYRESRFPNTGVMVLRGGPAAAEFLDQAWNLERYSHHQWWENAAVCELLGYGLDPPRPLQSTSWREQTTFISSRWNWIPNARVRRARIRHFPGYSVTTRQLMMRAALLEAGLRRARSRSDPVRGRASSAA
jgi:hypothetical protein